MTKPQAPTPLSDAALTETWPEFCEAVLDSLEASLLPAWGEMRSRCYERLLRGKVEYGDGSFSLPIAAQIDEIRQEYLDVVGWSFIAYCSTGDAALRTLAHEAVRGYAQTVKVQQYFDSLPKSVRPF